MISMKVSINMNALPPGLAWYAKRLSAMGPTGVMHRMRDAFVVQSLHMRHRLSGSGTAQRYTAADIPRHYFCATSEPVLPHIPLQFQPTDEDASQLLSGRLPIFGHEWTWHSQASAWHEAPDTKQQWPQVFFHRISYGSDNPYGDIRIAWEPSRLQHLVALALYAQQAAPDHRRKAVEVIEAQLLSWIAANPPLVGIHYVSVMECAVRLIAVCHTVDLIREWLTNPQEIWVGVLNLVGQHAELIRKRTTGYSTTAHHTIAEAVGLLYAGLLFPKMDMAERWFAFGLYLLENEATRQIRQDGGGREESFCALRFVSDLYGLAIHLLQQFDRPVPNKLEDAFARSSSFLQAMMRPVDGALPQIGEGDDGYALSPHLHFVSVPKAQSPGLTSFHLSGYSLIHGQNRQRLLFNHGELGMAPRYSQGHADALAVTLEIGNREVLIDPGTYTVTQDTAWRQYFRGTRAHNTVTVNGQDQAIQETGFLWSQPYATHLIYREEAPNGTITILARHYGYLERFGVSHWRGIVYQPQGAWLIWDWLTGTGTHHLELNWHLGVTPVPQPASHLFVVGEERVQCSVEGGQVSLHCGEENPIRGWHASHYGSRTPTTTLRAEYRGTLPHEFMTRIWMGEGAPPDSLQAFSLSGWSRGSSLRA